MENFAAMFGVAKTFPLTSNAYSLIGYKHQRFHSALLRGSRWYSSGEVACSMY